MVIIFFEDFIKHCSVGLAFDVTQKSKVLLLSDLFNSSNKYLLSLYYVAGTVLSVWDTSLNQTKILTFQVGGLLQQT